MRLTFLEPVIALREFTFDLVRDLEPANTQNRWGCPHTVLVCVSLFSECSQPQSGRALDRGRGTGTLRPGHPYDLARRDDLAGLGITFINSIKAHGQGAKSGFAGSDDAVGIPSPSDWLNASTVPGGISADAHASSDRKAVRMNADVVDFSGLDLVRSFDLDSCSPYERIACVCASHE